MFAAFLVSRTKLLRTSCGLFLLRRISSNTSSATAVSLKRLEDNHPALSSKQELNRNYTVSYLVESCGLSPKDAASASEKITTHFATPERPNSVLDLLRSHGFNSTQITRTVRIFPYLLLLNSDKIISPKLEFFLSLGLSTDDLAQIVSYSPLILGRSLKNEIEPVCNWIRSLVLSNERVCTAIKRSPWILLENHEKFLVPNVALLQKLQVPATCISLLLTQFPSVLEQNHEVFSAAVSKVKEMGFDPSKSTFVLAVQSISGKGRKQILDRCYKMYSTRWGWSEEDILSAFKKHPHCMTLSEKKLNSAMEFLANTMGWPSKRIAHWPVVLTYSLEKRTIPRCSVIRVLWKKGLISKDLSIGRIMGSAETIFLKRYVTRYEEQVPQLLSIYKGKTNALAYL